MATPYHQRLSECAEGPAACSQDRALPESGQAIRRIVAAIDKLQVTDVERIRWNREIGLLLNLARDRKDALVRYAVLRIQQSLQGCLVETLSKDLALPAQEITEAIAHGYSVDELYELGDTQTTKDRGRAVVLSELQTAVQVLSRLGLHAVNRAATQVSAALNSPVRKLGLQEWSREQCRRKLVGHVEALPEFTHILQSGDVRGQLATSPALLATAFKRLGALSVHFLGQDEARRQNRDSVTSLLKFSVTDGTIEAMTLSEVLDVLRSLRQLLDQGDLTMPEARRCIRLLNERGVALVKEVQDSSVAVGALHSLTCHSVFQPIVSDFRNALLGKISASSPARYHARDVGMSLTALADIERMQAKAGSPPVPHVPKHAPFIDNLATRAVDLQDELDVVSGSSAFTAFAHIGYRSPAVHRMLQELMRTGPTWAQLGRSSDIDKRTIEDFWAMARMGLSGEHAGEFARFLANVLVQRLPRMNLSEVSRTLWSSMVLQHMDDSMLSDDLLQSMLLRADTLMDTAAGQLSFAHACQLYHAQIAFRGYAHPRCVGYCRGNADVWLESGQVPKNLSRLSHIQPDQAYVSPAENVVRQHLQSRFGPQAQHDVFHHGYGLDVAVRIAPKEGKPYFIDVEIDGASHQSEHHRHTDRLRDTMLTNHFGVTVVRLPYCTEARDLLPLVDARLANF